MPSPPGADMSTVHAVDETSELLGSFADTGP